MRSYLKSRRRVLFLLLASALIFTVVFALYDLPWQASLYGFAIVLFMLAAYAVRDYAAYRARRALLRQMRDETVLTLDRLPPPRDPLEADYQTLLRAVYDDRLRRVDEQERQYRALVEYYTLWAHQIKTPIAGMRLILQEGVPERRVLREELFRIEQYVGMALTYLRLTGDTTDLVLKRCPLDPIIRQTVKKFAPQFIRKKLRLTYEPVAQSALTDEKWLSFVLEQVLSNAVKYTHEGGVTIRVEAPLTLVIEDTGIGIASEDLPRVFDRSFTGFNGRRDKEATGIGLYLCRRVMKKLGHGIVIESEPGQGTRVRLHLAAAPLEVE